MSKIFSGKEILLATSIAANATLAGLWLHAETRIASVHTRLDEARKEVSDRAKELSVLFKAHREDKKTAIDQVLALVDQGGSATHTAPFMWFARQYPWMTDALDRSVGQVVSAAGLDISVGSAVLLDTRGTVVLATHELKLDSEMRATFHLGDDKAVTGTITDFRFDTRHDVMFGTLVLDAYPGVKEAGLSPVSWNASDDVTEKDVAEILSAGFAWPDYRLHVTQGKRMEFHEQVDMNLGDDNGSFTTMFCKVESSSVVFHGMSGGLSFDLQGTFLGINNSGSDPGTNADAHLTPAALIRGAYVMLYPQNAKEAGIKAPADAQWPEACRLHPQDFRIAVASASFPRP